EQASRDTAIGTDGKITVTLANGKEHTLDMSGKDTSLQGVMNAINADAELGMKATIINTGATDQPYRLQLSAADTGEAASIASIKVDGNTDLGKLLDFNSGNPTSLGLTEVEAM